MSNPHDGGQGAHKTLSDDAKIIAGCMFGILGIPGRSTLTYHMQESRPTARAQKALDELVAAGVLTVKPFNKFGGVTYTVQIDTADFGHWAMRNRKLAKAFGPVTEPIQKATHPR